MVGTLLSLEGCGGGGTPSPTPAPTPSPTAPPTPSPTIPISETCELSRYQDTWCVPSSTADPDVVNKSFDYICRYSGFDCTRCASDDVDVKTKWAYNSYFQSHISQGRQSCNFSGTGELVRPPYSPCRPRLNEKKNCQPIPNGNKTQLENDLVYICGAGGLDCSPINPGGKCVFEQSSDLQYKCEWAFDKYYQRHLSQGSQACAFNSAELVAAPCAEYNSGNPMTGKGYAYLNTSYCGTLQCGCIGDNASKSTGCLQCVTRSPDPSTCDFLCPWAAHVTKESTVVV